MSYSSKKFSIGDIHMPSALSPVWLSLFREPFSGLIIGKPKHSYQETLQQLEKNPELLGGTILDKAMAACCIGALWLKADFFEQAHELFQEVQTPTGSLWHGISHRREGDHGNASYWFARCPNHPAGSKNEFIPSSRSESTQKRMAIPDGDWQFDAFNHLVANRNKNGKSPEDLNNLQEIEWRNTFLWTLQKALGKTPPIA